MTLAQRIVEHVFSPDAPTDPDARVALVKDLLDRAEPGPSRAALVADKARVCLLLGRIAKALGLEDGCTVEAVAKAAEAKLARAETPTPDHAALAQAVAAVCWRCVKQCDYTPAGLLAMCQTHEAEAARILASQAAPAAPTTEAKPWHHVHCNSSGRFPIGDPREPRCNCVRWIERGMEQPTPPPAAPCPSCGSTDGFHTMRNCPAKPAAPSVEPDEAFDYGSILLDFRDGTSTLWTWSRSRGRRLGASTSACSAATSTAPSSPPSSEPARPEPSRDVLQPSDSASNARHVRDAEPARQPVALGIRYQDRVRVYRCHLWR